MRVASRFLLLLPLLATACAPALRGYSGDGVRLFVSGSTVGPVSLSVDVDGVRQDLGTVRGRHPQRYDLPLRGDGQPTLLVITTRDALDLVRVDTVRTRPGSVVDLQIQSPLAGSTIRSY